MGDDRRNLPILIAAVIGVVSAASIIETYVLPLIYSGIPIPFPSTGKPIGGILLPATFLHLLLAYGGTLAILLSAKKAGFKVEGLLPSSRKGITETAALLLLLLSGLLLWWFPLAVLPFLVAGIYLIFSETR
ncbi:hypothetical protein KEJ44_01700 [Candidatus Bathyarchaeota archaeon]|nr:hypothetical protein [Candidatus Bathyarchaeota archaeon]